MAGEGLNSNRGIGTGEAIVYDTSKPVNYYLQNAAKLAQQQALEQKALQEDLNKVKIDGVRDADRKEYIDKYNDWKNTYSKIVGEKNPIRKSELKTEFDKKALELQDLVNDSKSLLRGENEFTKVLLTKDRDNYTDDTVPRFQKNKTLSRNDPNYVRDTLVYQRQPDLSKVDDQFRQIDTDLMSRQQEANPVTGAKLKVGNRMGTNLEYKTTVDPAKQIYNYGLAFDTNRDIKYAIKQQYKQLFDTLPEEEAKAQAIADIVSKRPLSKVRNQLVMDEADWREKMLYASMLKKANAGDKKAVDDAALYRQKTIDDMIGGVQGSGERVKAVLSATGNYTDAELNRMIGAPKGSNFIEFRIPKKTVTSDNGLTKDDEDYKETTKVIPERTVLIDKRDSNSKLKLNQLLNDLTGEKISESKVQTGKPSGKVSGEVFTERGGQPKSTAPKSISRAELASKAEASGYSAKEYEKLLKAKGITIK